MRLFLGGDVMTGRGVDQILPRPAPPALFEPAMASALDYVALGEARSGPIPRHVDPAYVWGDLKGVLARRRPDLRIVNLETAITARGRPEPKGINYRMNPANAGVLTAVGIDACTLANNHVLDWGAQGLSDTLAALDRAGIAHAGAGMTGAAALAPAKLALPGGGRLVLVALGARSSGIPAHWAAGADRAGVAMLPEGAEAAAALVRQAAGPRRPGDLLAVSLHRGGNWGYAVTEGDRRLAETLVEEAGAAVVFGHSSHHPKAAGLCNGRLVLHGCGDLLNDYEGIAGHEDFRPELVLAWIADLDAATGACLGLEMVPLRIRGFRLRAASEEETAWLARRMGRECARLGQGVETTDEGTLRLAPLA